MKLKPRFSSYYVHILLGLVLVITLSSCHTGRQATITSRKSSKEHVVNYRNLLSHLPAKRRKLVEEAQTWLGTPYLYAGEEKGKGADCSGLVMRIYLSALDCKIPRNSAKQAEFCKTIKAHDAVAGDLVFFATGKNPQKVSHVGMLINDEEFIHSSSSKGVVITKLDNPWYSSRLLMYGRIPALD